MCVCARVACLRGRIFTFDSASMYNAFGVVVVVSDMLLSFVYTTPNDSNNFGEFSGVISRPSRRKNFSVLSYVSHHNDVRY